MTGLPKVNLCPLSSDAIYSFTDCELNFSLVALRHSLIEPNCFPHYTTSPPFSLNQNVFTCLSKTEADKMGSANDFFLRINVLTMRQSSCRAGEYTYLHTHTQRESEMHI